MGRRRTWALLGWMLLLSTLGGPLACAARQQPPATLRAFAGHLGALRCSQAYGLMSIEYRRQHRREEFLRLCRYNPVELREGAVRLRMPGVAFSQGAEIDYGAGGRMRLTLEGGKWKIAANPLRLYGQSSPREALRSFIRAIAARRYDQLLALVPHKWREHMSEAKLREELEGPRRREVEDMCRDLAARIDEPIEERGDEARMAYGEHAEVKFVREDGRWMIADLD